ncbi:MAG: beta-phosphoglucomutase [Victivallales bacterium]
MKDKMAKFRLASIEPWSVTEETFRPEMSMIGESIFTLANEYMGTRGNFEEGYGGQTMPGCYIGGIYVREKEIYAWKRACHPTYSHCIVNTVNWLDIGVEVGGETFRLDTARTSGYRRSLDMKEGILSRQLVFKTKDGSETALTWERLVSHADNHIGAIRFTLTAINHSKPVKITMALDGTKENHSSYTARTHTRMMEQGKAKDDLFLLTNIMTTGQYTMHRMHVDFPEVKGLSTSVEAVDKRVAIIASFTPEKGKKLVFDKIVSVWTSREAGYPHGLIPRSQENDVSDPVKEKKIVAFLKPKSLDHLKGYRNNSFDRVKKEHVAKVAHMWDNCDVEIDGDAAAQQGIRYTMFEMLSNYRGEDPNLNIGPKGYSSEKYCGRTFWDSESYCFPFYLFTNPKATRNLMEYRYNTLEPAKEQAKAFGYDGAMYPWTTLDGSEETGMCWEYWMGEIHINAIVGYAMWLYAHITGDKSYLYERGIEVLIEQCRYWDGRSAFIPYRGGYAINRVTGPSEFGQAVNNNWYTNFMAKWLLEYTVDLMKEMKTAAPDKLKAVVKRTGFNESESEKWVEIAAKMILPYEKDMDVFIEQDNYMSLNPFARETLDRDRDIPIEDKWPIERTQKTQFSKQPDVLLGIFLQRHKFSLEEKKKNYRFYEQRCVHTSSLSPAIHSILASEVGRYNQAYSYYLWGSRLDLDNFNNNTNEGLHISSMAGSWMNIIFGFGGMIYTGDILSFSPILPQEWKRYSFKFVYRENVIKVNVDNKQVTMQLMAGDKLKVKVYGKEIGLSKIPVSVPLLPEYVNRPHPKAILFDLDGVVVDTAKFHYLAWKEVADEEKIYFDRHINERLKGVSRMESLDIILERAERKYSQAEKEKIAEKKNAIYVKMLHTLTEKDILPGVNHFLDQLHEAKMKTAIVSASKNTDFILEQIGIKKRFDVLVTGNDTKKSKPDPEGMLLAAKRLGVKPSECVVIEDAAAGVEAAAAAGMRSLGIGDKTLLHVADYAIPCTKYLDMEKVQALY